VRECHSNESVKKRYLLERHYFAIIGSSGMKTVAHRYRHVIIITSTDHGLFSFINIDDLEQP